MEHIGNVREGAFNLIERYKFDSPADCRSFVAKQRAKGIWAFREYAGFEGGKMIQSSIACIRVVGYFE